MWFFSYSISNPIFSTSNFNRFSWTKSKLVKGFPKLFFYLFLKLNVLCEVEGSGAALRWLGEGTGGLTESSYNSRVLKSKPWELSVSGHVISGVFVSVSTSWVLSKITPGLTFLRCPKISFSKSQLAHHHSPAPVRINNKLSGVIPSRHPKDLSKYRITYLHLHSKTFGSSASKKY